ncbi:amidoligase family protein [Marinobacterium arenosum]|uniref:amidoligase family protein n=1 Tax=Marinobacterium arenosum TaxID=2862496 RepID=UPI001C974B79|nr:amidoligase family protein [Marinobacterium arenosum]MBY4677403.1 amidoligase family protein [Marinobacterium arenosum]
MASTLPLPDVLYTDQGRERRVGIELELAGIELPTIAACVIHSYGGQVRNISPYELEIVDSALGCFRVELDFNFLKRLAREQNEDLSTGSLELLVTDALAEMAKNLVPFELISPPVPISQIGRLEEVVVKLRQAGAKGTYDAVHYAFGLHFNPELPALNSETLLRYFKAYLCLQDWLEEREDAALTRRLSPYIQPFSKEYCRRVLRADYWPDLARFSRDYLANNPSRNRSLDLLPLLAYLDEAAVRAAIDDERVSKRPTLHYRLPNSDIDNPNWNLGRAWCDWLQVEALANDRPLLIEVCDHYLAHLNSLTPDWIAPWKEQVTQWLNLPSSV